MIETTEDIDLKYTGLFGNKEYYKYSRFIWADFLLHIGLSARVASL